MQDIHGIRPPIAVGLDPMVIKGLLSLLACILICLLVFFLIRKYLKNRKKDHKQAMLPMPLPPFAAAMMALEMLSGRLTDHPRIYYFDLTLILRQYISRTFDIHGAEMTSQEFIRHIKPLDIQAGVKNRIAQFLYHCDPIKYAGLAPEKKSIQLDLANVKEMIKQVEAGKQETEKVAAGQKEKNNTNLLTKKEGND